MIIRAEADPNIIVGMIQGGRHVMVGHMGQLNAEQRWAVRKCPVAKLRTTFDPVSGYDAERGALFITPPCLITFNVFFQVHRGLNSDRAANRVASLFPGDTNWLAANRALHRVVNGLEATECGENAYFASAVRSQLGTR